MGEPAIARRYGRGLGLLSGLFAALQVVVSVSAARENAIIIAGLQKTVDSLFQDVQLNPLNLASDVLPVVLLTYLAAAVAGLVMLGFAWQAGRMTAVALGRRAHGALAGFWVALWSGGVWLFLSLLATLVFRADGTISGVLTATPDGSRLGTEVSFLLLQNGIAALCGLGLGALAGMLGASLVRLPRREASPLASPPFASPPTVSGLPTQPFPPQPAAGQAVAPWVPWAGAYPPPPEHYTQSPGAPSAGVPQP